MPASLPPEPATPHVIIPIELITISDTTNIAPVTEEAKLDDEAAEKEEIEAVAAAAAAAKPIEDIVELPDAETPPPPKKAEPKKAPPKPNDKMSQAEVNAEIDGILASTRNEPPKQQRNNDAPKAANAAPAAPRMGVGDMKRMTATITEVIRSQLVTKRCWTDHSDMADARRLTVTIRVRFGKDGRFSQPPELIAPTREPSGDPPMQVFLSHARNALAMCNTLGWQIPAEYYKLEPAPYYIDLVFVPKAAAMQQ